jgi:hypothetical protein
MKVDLSICIPGCTSSAITQYLSTPCHKKNSCLPSVWLCLPFKICGSIVLLVPPLPNNVKEPFNANKEGYWLATLDAAALARATSTSKLMIQE